MNTTDKSAAWRPTMPRASANAGRITSAPKKAETRRPDISQSPTNGWASAIKIG